jgi:ABC-type branched-subunit amino acid transport system ATPase component
VRRGAPAAAASAAAGLAADGIVVRFGGLVALNGAGVIAARGRITGLIGPNGAGKTTMFNVCCGFQPHAAGRVTLDGADITRKGPVARAKMGVGRTFQRLELFRSLTVLQNVSLAVEAKHINDDPLTQLGIRGRPSSNDPSTEVVAAEMLERVGIADLAGRTAGELSTGQARLLELARALARKPQLVLLDEPSSGLDVAETGEFGRLLCDLVADGSLGVLLVEHDMALVLDICQSIYVLDFGVPLMSGSPEDIRASEQVRAAYLGRDTNTSGETTLVSGGNL